MNGDPSSDGRFQSGDKAVGGRPTKLTPELQDRFLDAIRAGNYRETAAKYAGISPATLYRWLRDPRDEYQTFRVALEAAEAEAEVVAVTSIATRVPDDPRLAMEFLARRFPQGWARTRKAASGGAEHAPEGGASHIAGEPVGPPKLLQRLDRLRN